MSIATATAERDQVSGIRCGFGGARSPSRSELLAAPVRWPRPSNLDLRMTRLQGVGPRFAAAASDAGLDTLGDLLLHVPHGHRDRSEVRSLDDLRIGETATVQVTVERASIRRPRRRGLTIVEATVADDTASTKASWFNQPWLADRLTPGTSLLLVGSLDRRSFRVSEHEFLSPAGGASIYRAASSQGAPATGDPGCARIRPGAAGEGTGPRNAYTAGPVGPLPRQDPRAERFKRPPSGIHTTGLVPVHPATEKLKPQRIREWAWQAMAVADDVIEPLPAKLRARRDLAGAADAIQAAHFPASEEEAEAARRRLAFEELFLYQVALATRRQTRRNARPGARLGARGKLVQRWLASLPFRLTDDQRRACEEIDADLDAGEPMQRLLMGEVGSGKTVVALYAMLRALEAGHQAALMAPTETLAEQHAGTLDRLLGAELVPFELLTGATAAPRRRAALARLASGELSLVIGTHALIDDEVRFSSLGLCVVDEQHRFGVHQRAALDAKGPGAIAPHVLHMTATPIPRTLSLTAYGDLDTTTLRQLPAGRPPVRTWLVEEDRRAGAYEFIRRRLGEGRQAFVVCPLVKESEKLQARAARVEAKRLAQGEFQRFEVDVIDGQMSSAAKQAAMEAFTAGRTQVLVATTVVEVGIDVPNATVMLIESAERYGVSQLHQLRGRVGRGSHESHCILFTEEAGELARRRLQAVAAQRDGFALAEVDLSLRGEGEILGTRQHGLPRFAVASLPDDIGTLLEAREETLELLRRHGSLEASPLGPLVDAVRRRFGADEAEPIPA